jgi:hypothetical protein
MGDPVLGISEEEADQFIRAAAKVIASQKPKPMKKAVAKLEKHGPWTSLLLIAAAIYGPRLFILWNAWRAQKAKSAKRLAVMPTPPAAPPEHVEVDSSSKVN